MLKTNTTSLFFKYVIPSILGLLAISSATIVDGYFIGNYVGSTGLAAINIAYPISTLLFGFALMFAVGSSIIVSKLMGEKNIKEALNIFSKSVISVSILSIIICALLLLNIDTIFNIFKLEDELRILANEYLSIILLFLPFLMSAIVIDYFVRVDENPNLSFFALLLSSIINVILDYYFIVELNMGLSGAAYATGISQAIIIFVLIPHFFFKKSTLKLIKPTGSWKIIFKTLKNGSSEFINESSAGITVMIFNYIMLEKFGVNGVASYTIIGYFLMISIMISFAVSDALQPIISKNYGAEEFKRIKSFLKHGFMFILFIETFLTLVILLAPEFIINLFLHSNEIDTKNITIDFISYAWPVFILSGLNILITSYLTSMQKPFYSALIAILRSLIFPILFIIVLPTIFGDKGIFMALAIAEFITLIISINIFIKNSPSNFEKAILIK